MTPKRSILLVNWNDRTNPWAGGAEIHLHETFGRLARRGHRVTLLCSGYPGARAAEVLDDLEVVRVGGRYTFPAALPGVVRRWGRERRFDVIVEALNKIPLCTPLFANVPVLGIGHHLFGLTIFREVPLPMSLVVLASEVVVPWVYRGVLMEVISESTREDFVLRGLSPERMRVVYVGVDPRQYGTDGGERESAPTLLALGRVRKYKRLDLVVDAVAKLAREGHPELRLVVAGTGNHLDALKRHAQRTGAGAHVTFLGRVTEEEKVRLYRRAWALVMTSPKEGWGLTCLEAQSCGTPVIASDSPGLREAVRHEVSGLLVPHADRERLAEAMRRFLEEEPLRARLRRGALEFAGTFSWERAADQTMQLIEEAIAGREAA